MLDNLFGFAAQLARTPRARFATVAGSQSIAVAVLVGLAGAVGSTLGALPIRWVGVLALAPWALGWRRWRHRHDDVLATQRRGVVTTFLLTLGLGGDNLAVWIPLMRASGVLDGLALGAVFAVWQMLFVGASWALATHPRVVDWGQRAARYAIPWLYFALGLVVLAECRVT